jgi:hypothetical protein
VVAAMVAAKPKEIPMTKLKSKRIANKIKGPASSAGATARKITKIKPGMRSTGSQRHQPSAEQTGRSESKQAGIIAMLRAPGGATIEAMTHATGWQQHSVRGFLAGVVRRRLGLNLESVRDEAGRIYRIMDRTALPVAATKTNRAA